MNIENLKQKIENVLRLDQRIWVDDELNQTKLLDLLDNIDETVISLLLDDEELRDKFFMRIKDVFVFKTNDFKFFMQENKVNNSYTQYKNRIGLTDGKRYLKDSSDVVLDFPYKDCILEGGQSNEEGLDNYFEYNAKNSEYEQKTAKRNEIFFNQILAKDEIDRLLDPKALVNWQRYTAQGAEDVTEIKRDVDGTIKENLIIKGNNLLALHSLKKQFAGKVKLIYIDPPYNTGSDDFKYNDKYNHSTWLTFMKNRLEVAQKLLRDDGVIFVQCDDNEQAYLKVLMDDVFGRECVDCIVWQKMDARYDKNTNAKVINRYKEIHEYIIVGYRTNKITYFFNKIKRLPDWKKEQTNLDKDPRGNYQAGIISFEEGHDNEDKKSEYYYSITLPSGRVMTRHFFVTKLEFLKLQEDNRIYFPKNGDGVPRLKIFEKEEQEYKLESILRGFGTSSTAKNEVENIFANRSIFETPKPEKLIAELIRCITNERDIVLDYHLGSGTTAAVAHKMNRQYIGIEQMDYIENIAVERMKKVVAGEQGGVSKSVTWQGGGDFIYCELAKWNETAKEKILECVSLNELIGLFDELYSRYFLNYNLKINEFKECVINEDDFKNLSLDKQKEIFITMLDNNQMYVNQTEMADSKYELNCRDIELTTQFYKKK